MEKTQHKGTGTLKERIPGSYIHTNKYFRYTILCIYFIFKLSYSIFMFTFNETHIYMCVYLHTFIYI